MMDSLPLLVGIPWSSAPPPEGADCLTLAVYAQAVLWGRHINLWDYGDPSWACDEEALTKTREALERGLTGFCDPVDSPQVGDMATISAFGYVHVVTFINPFSVLHILQNRRSRISRYGEWMKRRTRAFWRVKEGIGLCLSRQGL